MSKIEALEALREQIDRLPEPLRESLAPRVSDSVDEGVVRDLAAELKAALDRLPGLVEDIYEAAKAAPAAVTPNLSSRFVQAKVLAQRAEQQVAGATRMMSVDDLLISPEDLPERLSDEGPFPGPGKKSW